MNTTVSPLVTVLVALALFCGGYWYGHSREHSARVAEVASLTAGYAQAQAQAERLAREHLEAQAHRAATLAVELDEARRDIGSRVTIVTKRIPYAASAAPDCRFGREFVRLYNQALYPGGGTLPAGPGAPGTDQDSRAAGPAGPGVFPGAPAITATPEDLLAHVRDYGAWAQGLAAQLRALGQLVDGGR